MRALSALCHTAVTPFKYLGTFQWFPRGQRWYEPPDLAQRSPEVCANLAPLASPNVRGYRGIHSWGAFTPLQLFMQRCLRAVEGTVWTSHPVAQRHGTICLTPNSEGTDPQCAEAGCFFSASSLSHKVNTAKKKTKQKPQSGAANAARVQRSGSTLAVRLSL